MVTLTGIRTFLVVHLPANDFAAVNIHEQVQVRVHSAYRRGQVGNVPTVELIAKAGVSAPIPSRAQVSWRANYSHFKNGLCEKPSNWSIDPARPRRNHLTASGRDPYLHLMSRSFCPAFSPFLYFTTQDLIPAGSFFAIENSFPSP